MSVVAIHLLGRRGWQLACRTAQLETILMLSLALAAGIIFGLAAALSLFWGGAALIIGRWLTALAVFRQAGAPHAATALRALMRGSFCTWLLALLSAPLAWKLCQLPPLPFLLGMAVVAVMHVFMPWLIEHKTG